MPSKSLIGKHIPVTEYILNNDRLRGRRVTVYSPAKLDPVNGEPYPGAPAIKLEFKGGRMLTNNPIDIQRANIAMQRHMKYVTTANGLDTESLIKRRTLDEIKAEKTKKQASAVDKFLQNASKEQLEALRAKLNALS